MEDPQSWPCQTCGSVGFSDCFDGFFYCLRCGSQADDMIETGVADEDLVRMDGETGGRMYMSRHIRRQQLAIKVEPVSQHEASTIQSQFWNSLALDNDHGAIPYETKREPEIILPNDAVGPVGPEDFGIGGGGLGAPTYDDYSNEVRMRYVLGLQLMIEFQSEVLVREFKVSPLICGLAATIWLRFVAASRVFDDKWVYQTIQDSENQHGGDPQDVKPVPRYREEPHNLYGERAIMIWFRSLRKRIPLSCSLSIVFLACHVAREMILPTDIEKWSLEGKLPYFAAFIEIEKHIGQTSSVCPISSMFMFRPSRVPPLQKLESFAALIAHSIGLNLPPVNFHAIASRYLNKLALPLEKILPHACHIYDWSMPPNLWLSTNELRLPTRVCVMSILIISVRVLYNLNGFGYWEKSLSNENTTESIPMDSSATEDGDVGTGLGSLFDGSCPRDTGNASHLQASEFDAAELLQKLEARYDVIADTYQYSKNLPSYLQYCKDVVFAGLETSFEDREEERLIDQFWDYYKKVKDFDPTEDLGLKDATTLIAKRSRDKENFNNGVSKQNKKLRDDQTSAVDHSEMSQSSQSTQDGQNPRFEYAVEATKDEAIRRIKIDMEEKRFSYIPPRSNLKRLDYLHYGRKRNEGALAYAAHADYYILLRACARAAQVDVRIMHIGVLSLEKRLSWLESRIDLSLHQTFPHISCQHCSDVREMRMMIQLIFRVKSIFLFIDKRSVITLGEISI